MDESQDLALEVTYFRHVLTLPSALRPIIRLQGNQEQSRYVSLSFYKLIESITSDRIHVL